MLVTVRHGLQCPVLYPLTNHNSKSNFNVDYINQGTGINILELFIFFVISFLFKAKRKALTTDYFIVKEDTVLRF